MDKKYISITELAKLRKVTSETLRYYDKIGLLKPDYINPDNGYRYYTARKSEKLGVIRELRELGMSIEDIQNYFKDCNLKKSINILSKQYFKMQSDIESSLILCNKITKKLTFLGELLTLNNINKPFLKKIPERYIITLNKKTKNEIDYLYAFSELETILTEESPILATDRLGVYSDENILEEGSETVQSTPMLFVDKYIENEKVKQYEQIVSENYYLCIVYENGRLEKYNPCFEKIKEYMRDNNLVVCGDIFQRYLIDVTMTSKRSETLMELQVPVKIKE